MENKTKQIEIVVEEMTKVQIYEAVANLIRNKRREYDKQAELMIKQISDDLIKNEKKNVETYYNKIVELKKQINALESEINEIDAELRKKYNVPNSPSYNKKLRAFLNGLFGVYNLRRSNYPEVNEVLEKRDALGLFLNSFDRKLNLSNNIEEVIVYLEQSGIKIITVSPEIVQSKEEINIVDLL